MVLPPNPQLIRARGRRGLYRHWYSRLLKMLPQPVALGLVGSFQSGRNQKGCTTSKPTVVLREVKREGGRYHHVEQQGETRQIPTGVTMIKILIT